jgi:hypothetical protein
MKEMRMNRNLIYKEEVEVTEELDRFLKKCFKNHLILYNYALSKLIEDPNIDLIKIKSMVYDYTVEHNIRDILRSALYMEIHYLYKKFTSNNLREKLLTNIQYLTFIVFREVPSFLTIERDYLKLGNFRGEIRLHKPLESVKDYDVLYVNLSYSSKEDKYMLSIFAG